MPDSIQLSTYSESQIIERIYIIRGIKVMLDKDLADMYGVDVKVLNQAVKRNHSRFPEDFMFQLFDDEWKHLKSQFVTSSWGGVRKLPFAFTEQGVAMLSSVLRSEIAIKVNIQIIRVYTKMKYLLFDNKDLWQKIEKIEQSLIRKDEEIQAIFKVLKQLLLQNERVHSKLSLAGGDTSHGRQPWSVSSPTTPAKPLRQFGMHPNEKPVKRNPIGFPIPSKKNL